MIDETLNETNPLSDFSDQLRAVEALLFASSDPIDEKTLIEILPAVSYTHLTLPTIYSV